MCACATGHLLLQGHIKSLIFAIVLSPSLLFEFRQVNIYNIGLRRVAGGGWEGHNLNSEQGVLKYRNILNKLYYEMSTINIGGNISKNPKPIFEEIFPNTFPLVISIMWFSSS